MSLTHNQPHANCARLCCQPTQYTPCTAHVSLTEDKKTFTAPTGYNGGQVQIRNSSATVCGLSVRDA
jgi:hypothetical protein